MKRSRMACAALILMTVSILAVGAADADKYAVKAPIKIQWWHAMEAQYKPLIDKVVADFEKQNPMIDVEAIYQGSYADLNEKLIAAQAAGTTLPALCVANTPGSARTSIPTLRRRASTSRISARASGSPRASAASRCRFPSSSPRRSFSTTRPWPTPKRSSFPKPGPTWTNS